jgi:hypothetical protein
MAVITRCGKGRFISNLGDVYYDWEGESIDGYVDYKSIIRAFRFSSSRLQGKRIYRARPVRENGILMVARAAGGMNLAESEDIERKWKCTRGWRCHPFVLDYREYAKGEPTSHLQKEYLEDERRDNYFHILNVHLPCDKSSFCTYRLINKRLRMELKDPNDYINLEKFETETIELLDKLRTLYGRTWEAAQNMIMDSKGINAIYGDEFLIPAALR